MEYLVSFGLGVFTTLMIGLPAAYVVAAYLLRKQQDDLVWKFTSQSQRHEDRHYREKADLRKYYEDLLASERLAALVQRLL